jgi:hypothetical protein
LSNARLQIATTAGGNAISREVTLQFSPLQPGTTPQADGFFRYAVDTSTQWLVGQGRFPFVAWASVGGTGVMSGECTLIGDLVTPLP